MGPENKETNKNRSQSSRWKMRKMTRVGKERTNKIFGALGTEQVCG